MGGWKLILAPAQIFLPSKSYVIRMTYSLMLRKTSKTFMLSKAQREYFAHPSTYPAKNAGFAQDERFLCAASKHIIAQNCDLRNISYS